MIQVTQSPFLQALGYAIVNSLWQYALLWLIQYLISSITKLSSHKLYVLALSCHLTGFIWFTGTFIYYFSFCIRENGLPVISPDELSLQWLDAGSSLREKMYLVFLRAEQFLPYLSLAYIALLSFLTAKTIKSYRQTIFIRSAGLIKPPVEWKLFTARLSMQFGIKKQVKVFLSSIIESPVTIGFLKPLILLPVSMVNNLSTEQAEAILIHELAHIKRHDYLVNLLLSVIEITLFFNPFMQLISRNIRRERENSCDDWVLQYQYNAASYARALLKIATSRVCRNTAMAMPAVDNNRALLVRVKRMIERTENQVNYRQQLIALVSMTVLFVALTLVIPQKQKPAGVASSAFVQAPGMQREVELFKTDNLLFNPVYFLAKPIKVRVKVPSTDHIANATLLPAVSPAGKKEFVRVGVDIVNFPEIAINIPMAVQHHEKLAPPNTDSVRYSELQSLLKSNVLRISRSQLNSNPDQLKETIGREINAKELAITAANVKKDIEHALEQLKNIKIHVELSGKQARIAEQNALKSGRKITAEVLSNYKNAARSYAALAGLSDAVSKVRDGENDGEQQQYFIELPTTAPNSKGVSRSFSYEYKETPKSQIVIAPPGIL